MIGLIILQNLIKKNNQIVILNYKNYGLTLQTIVFLYSLKMKILKSNIDLKPTIL